MRVQTGQGTITLITLVAIWSISALTALPGLAISPILGKLSVIFPHATELDIQMLSSLPSLLIIPFIIVAGKLVEKVSDIRLLQIGLILFALSGFLYLISEKMWQLIVVSALMGIGSGLIIPLSTGLISRFFVGKFRTKQFGLSSAITNVTLVVATGVAGFLAEINWHLPFAVYLLPVASIALLGYLKRGIDTHLKTEALDPSSVSVPADPVTIPGKYGIDIKHLMQIMSFYGLATYLVIIISFNLPFLMEEYKFTSGNSGLMISLFFLAIMAPGFFLNQIVDVLQKKTKFVCLLGIAVGLGLILISVRSG